MNPSKALELVSRLDSFVESHKIFASDGIKALEEGLKVAAYFDYGDVKPEQEHVDFGFDMFDKGLFQLPYRTMWMRGNTSPGNHLLAFGPGESFDPTRDPYFGLITCGPGIPENRTEGDNRQIPIVPLMLSWVMKHDTENIKWRSLIKDPARYFRHRDGTPYGDGELQEISRKSFRLAVGWVTMLMSKEVETTIERAKPGVNERRVRQGKPPIDDRHVVRIRPEIIRQFTGNSIGERASPRMHWRRGHFRRLPSGVVIPIAPMIIGAQPGVIPPIKEYKLF